MTILDACTQILKEAGKPLSADEIYEEIIKRKLCDLKAKDPRAIVRGTIRKHLRSATRPRLRPAESGTFVAIE